MYFTYSLLLYFLTPGLILYYLLKKRSSENLTSISWRLGRFPKSFLPTDQASPRIWVHAASVGEVNAIVSLMKLLTESYPKAWIGLSTMTASGLEMAKVNLPDLSAHFLAPFDLPSSAGRAMRQIRPDLFITIETEIWPNLLKYAKKNGAKVLMVNGRVSVRSIGQYQKFKKFFNKVLSFYDVFCMIHPVDAERIKALGADPNKVTINGNIKFDRLSKETNPEFHSEIADKLHLTGNERILVAGSTREGEEELILEAYTQIKTKYPDLLLLIAPRHIQRGDEVAGIVRNHGFLPLLRTEITSNSRISPETVIILNTIGELFKVYSLASLTFCGASLVPLGGQNPLEPAAWGKVVLYGPSMEDFLDAKQFLEEAGSGIQVASATDLAEKAVELLADPGRLTSLGNAGQMLIRAQQGSSLRSLELIKSSLGGKSNGD